MHYIATVKGKSPKQSPIALGIDLQRIANALYHDLKTIRCANPLCGNNFKQNRHWQKYCSAKCRTDHFWSERRRVTIPVPSE